MKRKLGVLALTLSSLVISAACVSSGPPSKPAPQRPDDGQTWFKAAPSQLPSRPANATGVPMARLASR
jgi:hypothetical protein